MLWAVWASTVCPAPLVRCDVDGVSVSSVERPRRRWIVPSPASGYTVVPTYPQSCPQMWVDRRPKEPDVQIAILLYHRFTALDAVGPEARARTSR